MSNLKKATKKITTLRVGQGEVRVRIEFGISKEVLDGVWIKPRMAMEVSVPKDTPVDIYIEEEFLPYVVQKFKEQIKLSERLAGIVRKRPSNGR